MRHYPIPWRLNCAIVTGQLLAALGIFWLASLATVCWQVALLAMAFAIVGNSIYASMHEAEHGMLLPVRFYNDLVGSLLGLFFPAPFHLLRQGHLGHHWRNRSDDEAFDYYFPGENAVWKWLQLYGVLTGLFWLTIVFFELRGLDLSVIATAQIRFRSTDRGARRFTQSARLAFDSPGISGGAPVACVARLGFRHSACDLLRRLLRLWNKLVGNAIRASFWHGAARDRGARNLWLFAPIDLVWLHHNWHQTHHEQPTVPWIYLPSMSAEGGKRREFLLWHYLRMWRGPRLTNEHVENRYAERIIR